MKLKKLYFLLVLCVVSFFTANAQDKSVDNVLSAYFTLKNDLASDNFAAAKTHATEVVAAVKAVAADKLNAEQQATWKQYSAKLETASARINEAKDIDTQREYFAVLSKNMLDATKALKVNTAPVYLQYCPMKKVSWLSEAAAIKNPFYGKQMLTCGQVTETLAATK